MSKLIVRAKLRDLLPPLTEAEATALEASLLEEGCRDPLPVWETEKGDILLDGHNRKRLCEKHGIEYELIPVSGIERMADAMRWIVNNQLARRNLNESQRAMVAARMVTEQRGGDRKTNASIDALISQPQAAELLNVSRPSVQRAAQVLEHGDPETIAQVDAGELPVSRAARIIRDKDAEKKRAEKARAAPKPKRIRVDVRHGDFRECLAGVSGVDAIITDPPYPRKFLPLLDDLAIWANDALAPDGVLVVLFGQTYLPEVYRRLEGGRPYRWTGCYLTPGAGYVSHARKVQSNWKPLIVYGGKARFGDVVRSDGDTEGKEHHEWGQDFTAFRDIVERFTEPGQTVVDPFMGAGTTLLAARDLGRHSIGCDIDAEHVKTTKGRLGIE